MIYQISSGQGPAECELGVAKFLEYLQKNYDVTVLDFSEGYNADTYRSVRFSSPDDLSCYIGSVQWVCQSTYRPRHKRKNWFLDFSVCVDVETSVFDENHIRFEPIHSHGNGGQNINKVESGIRAIYIPTGDMVVCTEERSQLRNKQKATKRLREIIERTNNQLCAKESNNRWKRHTRIVRGNSKVIFIGEKFTPMPQEILPPVVTHALTYNK